MSKDRIAAIEFCTHYNVELSFIESLRESALIEVITVQDAMFIDEAQLPRLEKLVRLHVDLGINLEGIETILHLQERMHEMHVQITKLKNDLRRYQRE